MNRQRCFYFIVILIPTAIFLFQWLQVYRHQYSRWAGGGMGMYADYPRRLRVLNLTVHTPQGEHTINSFDFLQLQRPDGEVYVPLIFYIDFPSRQNLSELAQTVRNNINHVNQVDISIYSPQFDLEDHSVSYNKLLEEKF